MPFSYSSCYSPAAPNPRHAAIPGGIEVFILQDFAGIVEKLQRRRRAGLGWLSESGFNRCGIGGQFPPLEPLQQVGTLTGKATEDAGLVYWVMR